MAEYELTSATQLKAVKELADRIENRFRSIETALNNTVDSSTMASAITIEEVADGVVFKDLTGKEIYKLHVM